VVISSMPENAASDAGEPEGAAGSLVGQLVEVDVERVAHGGFCVARHEGRAVFVRHTLPGERVRALVTEGDDTDRYLRADAVEILTASPDRVKPPCPHAAPGGCGGCDWQHVAPAAQRRLKADVVAEQLRRLADLDWPVEVEEVPSPDGAEAGLGWRSRVRFAVTADGRLGLRKHRSHEVVPIDACPIADASVEAVGAERRSWPGMSEVEVIAASGSSDRAVVVTPTPGARLPHVTGEVPVSVLLGDPDSGVARRVHGRPFVREVAAGRTWRVSGSGFWQVHPAAPKVLTAAVLDALRPEAGETAVDLYCGVGLFAGVLAAAVGADGYVVGVESDPLALGDARHNLADLSTVRLVNARADHALRTGLPAPARLSARRQLDTADLVVLDPPRTGAGRAVVDRIVDLCPRAVGYVSCDPATLARDVSWFAAAGYRLAALRAFDLFPMTQHVECVAVLEPA
jgi:tRNA/tmRNA/rRNA uracil-C5-methylase (TrmA/RlmC/RlmD family)